MIVRHGFGLALPYFYEPAYSHLIADRIHSFGILFYPNGSIIEKTMTSRRMHCILSLEFPVNWNIERLIWINYAKEKQCFARLPKCIVKKILQYTTWTIFEDINKFMS